MLIRGPETHETAKTARTPETFFAEVESLLIPEEPVGREGGRLQVPQRIVIRGLVHADDRLPIGGMLLEPGCLGRTSDCRI